MPSPRPSLLGAPGQKLAAGHCCSSWITMLALRKTQYGMVPFLFFTDSTG